MLKIYKYYTDEKWDEVRNSPTTDDERDKLIQEYIETHGQLVTVQEYFADSRRNVDDYWDFAHQRTVSKGYCYTCYGEPQNCIEKLAYAEMHYDNELYYCELIERSPEDLNESMDWEDLKGCADGLVYFLNRLKEEIAEGKITVK